MVSFRHLFDNGRVIHTASCYGNNDLEVVEKTEEGESIRLLLVNGARESATYIDKAHRNDLVFRYAVGFNDVFEINKNLKDCLLLGGAGFSYPKYFISRFPEKTLDVVEIDEVMVNVAFKYFYLDELYDEYDLYENERLKIYVMDGLKFLSTMLKSYDVIFNDAYISDSPAEGLMSYEAIRLIKERLNPGGIYVANMITAMAGKSAYPLFSILANLSRYLSIRDFANAVMTYPQTKNRTV